MDRTDAFGRPTGEDPLAAMGWSSGESTTASVSTAADASADALAEPAGTPAPTAVTSPPADGAGWPEIPAIEDGDPLFAAAEPAAAGASTPATYHRGRRGRGGALVAIAAVLSVLGVLVLSAGAFIVPWAQDVADEIERSVDDVVPEVPGTPAGPGAERRAAPPTGLGNRSLLVRRNLAPTLRVLRRRAGGGRVRYLRVSAERVDVQVITRSRRQRSMSATWDGQVDAGFETLAPGLAAASSFPWSAVDAAAPSRIVRSVTGRLRRPARAFDYAVLIEAAGLRWSAFARGGRSFTSTPDGRRTQSTG